MVTKWSCNDVFISPLEVATASEVPLTIFSTREKRSTDILFATDILFVGPPPYVSHRSRVHPEFSVVSFDISCRYKRAQVFVGVIPLGWFFIDRVVRRIRSVFDVVGPVSRDSSFLSSRYNTTAHRSVLFSCQERFYGFIV